MSVSIFKAFFLLPETIHMDLVLDSPMDKSNVSANGLYLIFFLSLRIQNCLL